MLDARIRRITDPVLDRIGAALAQLGPGANAVTVCGFLIGVGSWAALWGQAYVLALVLILVNRVADGLDGAVARRTGLPDLGGCLDIVLDFIFYAGAPVFFAAGRPQDALPAAFLVFGFVGTGSSFLAFASIAAKRGLATEARGRKSVFYLGGLTEGAETIALFVLICLWPGYFAWMACVFGALCWLTTASRIAFTVTAFCGPGKGGAGSSRPRPREPGRRKGTSKRRRLETPGPLWPGAPARWAASSSPSR